MKAFCHIFVKYAQSLGIFSACTLSSGIFSIKQHIFYQTVFHLCFNFGLLIKITVLERILKIIPANCTPHFKLLGLQISKMMQYIRPSFGQRSPLYHALWVQLTAGNFKPRSKI